MLDILHQDIQYLPGIGPHRKALLSGELGLNTLSDLLEYYPYKYVDRSRIYTIKEIRSDMPFVQIRGQILSFEEFDMGPRRKRLVAHFSDGTGIADFVWFTGAQYIRKEFKTGVTYIAFGRPTVFGGRYQMAHPELEQASELQLSQMGMQPYYGTTEKMKKAGMTSRTIEKIMKGILERINTPLEETLPLSDFLIMPCPGHERPILFIQFHGLFVCFWVGPLRVAAARCQYKSNEGKE